jgi:hypothetical protein
VPIAACRACVSRLAAAGADAQLVEYAGADHAFDVPRAAPLTFAGAPTAGI